MIPTSLSLWTLDAVLAIAASGIAENDLFDLKADLQPAEHQRRIVAAFANTRGGYLVFGVTNDRNVVGVSNDELPRDFGTKLRAGLEPSVDFVVGPPIAVSPGKNVFVIEVPRSSRVPHAVQVNGSWCFLKRTASGSNEAMSYEEIRLAFQDTEMKRSKLALLASELDLIEAVAARVIQGIPEDVPINGLYRWAWVTRYPVNLLDAVLGDAYSLLARDRRIWDSLNSFEIAFAIRIRIARRSLAYRSRPSLESTSRDGSSRSRYVALRWNLESRPRSRGKRLNRCSGQRSNYSVERTRNGVARSSPPT